MIFAQLPPSNTVTYLKRRLGSDTSSPGLPGQVFLVLALIIGCGCGGAVKKRTEMEIPKGYQQIQTATLDELVQIINERYADLKNISVSDMEVEFQEGSIEEGYFERYRRARGYLIAKRPDAVYVNIQNPLTRSTVSTMATNEGNFEIWVPSENKYLTGRTNLTPDEKRPLHNVRPEHLLNALLIEPIPTEDPSVLYALEEKLDSTSKYYVISVLDAPKQGTRVASLRRRLWIERTQLRLVRQRYYEGGHLVSTIGYSSSVELGSNLVPSGVEVDRLQEHYTLRLRYQQGSVTIDRALKTGIFQIPFPPGAQRVIVK